MSNRNMPSPTKSSPKDPPPASILQRHRTDAQQNPPSPSSPRQLHRRTRSLGDSYRITPIEKHYALNQQILIAFDALLEQHAFQIAYAVGLQFVEMALLEIPKHGYFYSSRHDEDRKQNTEQALRVTQQLQEILQQTEYDPSLENVRVEKLARLAGEQATVSPHAYEKDRVVVEQELCELRDRQQKEQNSFGYMDAGMLCAQLSESFSEGICPSQAKTTVDDNTANRIAPEAATGPYDQSTDQHTRRPSFSSSETDLERALYLSGMDVSLTDRVPSMTSISTATSRARTKSISEIDILTLRRCYHEDFEQLRASKTIRINHVDTYQGRLPGSINGCTVIAPLICLHHFSNYKQTDDPGLPDSSVRQVIDDETPALLPQVRTELGLTKDALIIPSDVHDFLLTRGMLSHSQFVSVCGGNIIDDQHVDAFWKLLSMTVPLEKRAAATVFFHEHVVAILRLKRGNGEVWYDVIDSLPFEDFLSQHDVVEDDDDEREAPEKSWRSMESDFSSSSEYWGEGHFTSQYVPYAVRVRCTDEEALKATLRWYACCKFDKANRTFIDMYNWDDQHCDFDPRVFQAFVWKEE